MVLEGLMGRSQLNIHLNRWYSEGLQLIAFGVVRFVVRFDAGLHSVSF